MGWQIEYILPCGPTAPGAARAIADTELAKRLGPGTSELAADVVLVVSELVTNAVFAGSTTVALALEGRDDQINVEITDDGIGWPQSRPTSTTKIDGRGLMIVAALAQRWGAKPVARGKAVWATFPLPRGA